MFTSKSNVLTYFILNTNNLFKNKYQFRHKKIIINKFLSNLSPNKMDWSTVVFRQPSQESIKIYVSAYNYKSEKLRVIKSV